MNEFSISWKKNDYNGQSSTNQQQSLDQQTTENSPISHRAKLLHSGNNSCH